MRSGELSIVAGIYCFMTAYLSESMEWVIASGFLLSFGVILMVDEFMTERIKSQLVNPTKRVRKKSEVEFKGYHPSPFSDEPDPRRAKMISAPLPTEERPRTKEEPHPLDGILFDR